MTEDWSEICASAWSTERDIKVTVGPHGQISDVTFAERVLNRSVDELALEVLETAARALDVLAGEIEQLAAEMSDAEEAEALMLSYQGMLEAHRRG